MVAAHLVTMDVAQDLDGLLIAAGEMLEESLAARIADRFTRRTAGAANSDRVGGPAMQRSLAGGYYDWVRYLFELELMRSAGVSFSAHDLQDREVRGLAMLGEARSEFERRHPRCPGCGQPLAKVGVLQCWNCNERFDVRKKA